MDRPAFADQLTVAEVYRTFQGDWEFVSQGKPVAEPCQSNVQRLTLDTDGLGLSLRDVQVDGSIVKESKYRLSAIPTAGDGNEALIFLGPDVDRSEDQLVWQTQLRISMTDADHLNHYVGYVRWPGPRTDGLIEIVPHGYDWDMIRCR